MLTEKQAAEIQKQCNNTLDAIYNSKLNFSLYNLAKALVELYKNEGVEFKNIGQETEIIYNIRAERLLRCIEGKSVDSFETYKKQNNLTYTGNF